MKVLIVNDDGYKAKGIRVLANTLKQKYQVAVVSPCYPMSGASHSMTLGRNIYVKKKVIDGVDYYIVKGTPCDCTKFGLLNVLPDADVVVSGINDLTNIGTDVIYSGTCNAAFEAGILGKKGLAVSLTAKNNYYDDVAGFVCDNLPLLANLSYGEFVPSINFESEHKCDWKGFKIVDIGDRRYDDYYVKNGKGYILKGTPFSTESNPNTDVLVTAQGFVSISISKICLQSVIPQDRDEILKKLCW